MPEYNATGIVLRRVAYGETDNILTLYTREHGKISAIAKGARRANSRLAGASEVLACARYGLATGKSLDIVRQAEVRNSFPALRRDLARLANGQYMAEVLSHFVVDEDPHPNLFVLLRTALLLLERATDPEIAARWYDLHLLGEIGYIPDLAECIVCQSILPRQSDTVAAVYALSASHGGALCPEHAHPRHNDDHSRLSYDALVHMQGLSEMGIENVKRVLAVPSLSSEDTADVRLALRRYIRFRIDRDLRSLEFLDGLAVGNSGQE